ncbi:MAG TPA: SAM-dependent methyltransferase [Actinoplanes sp.]|nr:SAM-dependent methyltransferase [Actinoplanes sp.]
MTQLDTGVPHSARVWNHWLGGTDNFAADRAAGDEFARLYPDIVTVARSSRAFLKRAVTFLAAEIGVCQFLDVGTGIPSAEHTHQIVRAVTPRAQVVYVDNDPLVLDHAHEVLAGEAVYLDADLREPGSIIASSGLDFDSPVALILTNILGHIPDLDEAVTVVHSLMFPLPAGSYLVTADGTNVLDGAAFEAAIAMWNANAPLPYHLRHPDELARFLDGLELVPPGLVPCARWRPWPGATADELRETDEFAAVARKP